MDSQILWSKNWIMCFKNMHHLVEEHQSFDWRRWAIRMKNNYCSQISWLEHVRLLRDCLGSAGVVTILCWCSFDTFGDFLTFLNFEIGETKKPNICPKIIIYSIYRKLKLLSYAVWPWKGCVCALRTRGGRVYASAQLLIAKLYFGGTAPLHGKVYLYYIIALYNPLSHSHIKCGFQV